MIFSKVVIKHSILMFCIIFLSNCGYFSTVTQTPPTIEVFPNYLAISEPLPNGNYSISENNIFSVCLHLNARYLLQKHDQFITSDIWLNNSFLFIDGKNMGNPHHWVDFLSADTKGNEYGPFEYCWFIENLSEGWHVANYEIKDTSGVTHSYTWGFQLD